MLQRINSIQPILKNCFCQIRSITITITKPSSASSSTIPTTPVKVSPYALPKGLLLKGIVTSTGKMSQTSTVTVERRVTDHKTLKEFKKSTNYLIHDPDSICVAGDQVLIRNCLPVSKRKRFELISVLQGVKTVV